MQKPKNLQFFEFLSFLKKKKKKKYFFEFSALNNTKTQKDAQFFEF